MNRLYCSVLIISLILCITACGRVTTPLSIPAYEANSQTLRAEEVTIDTGAVTLAGTLLLPRQEMPAPAVILVPGSGAATRNGSWNMYRSIGEYLAGRGIAVLLCDKRGVGGSTGDWESETFDERAQDVAAIVKYLHSRTEIDASRIGLIGHSQGAYIAPLVVTNYSTDVKFVVLLAGSGQNVWDQVLTNERAESFGRGLSALEINRKVSNLEIQLMLMDRFQIPCRAFKVHYLCFVLNYDPAPALEKLTVPTLTLYAERDTQVPPDVNIPLVESALKKAGNTDYAIHTFENANHWFAQAETGTTSEMRELMKSSSGYEFVPGFLEMIGDWIASQVFAEAMSAFQPSRSPQG